MPPKHKRRPASEWDDEDDNAQEHPLPSTSYRQAGAALKKSNPPKSSARALDHLAPPSKKKYGLAPIFDGLSFFLYHRPPASSVRRKVWDELASNITSRGGLVCYYDASTPPSHAEFLFPPKDLLFHDPATSPPLPLPSASPDPRVRSSTRILLLDLMEDLGPLHLLSRCLKAARAISRALETPGLIPRGAPISDSTLILLSDYVNACCRSNALLPPSPEHEPCSPSDLPPALLPSLAGPGSAMEDFLLQEARERAVEEEQEALEGEWYRGEAGDGGGVPQDDEEEGEGEGTRGALLSSPTQRGEEEGPGVEQGGGREEAGREGAKGAAPTTERLVTPRLKGLSSKDRAFLRERLLDLYGPAALELQEYEEFGSGDSLPFYRLPTVLWDPLEALATVIKLFDNHIGTRKASELQLAATGLKSLKQDGAGAGAGAGAVAEPTASPVPEHEGEELEEEGEPEEEGNEPEAEEGEGGAAGPSTGVPPGPGCSHVACRLSRGCFLKGIDDVLRCYEGGHWTKQEAEFHRRPMITARMLVQAAREPLSLQDLGKLGKVRGMGPKTVAKLEQIFLEGETERARALLHDEERSIVALLSSLFYVGHKKALEMFHCGYRTLEEVRRDAREGRLRVTLQQQALDYLEHYEDLSVPIERAEVQQIGQLLRGEIYAVYESLVDPQLAKELAGDTFAGPLGSFRRGKGSSSDLDAIIILPEGAVVDHRSPFVEAIRAHAGRLNFKQHVARHGNVDAVRKVTNLQWLGKGGTQLHPSGSSAALVFLLLLLERLEKKGLLVGGTRMSYSIPNGDSLGSWDADDYSVPTWIGMLRNPRTNKVRRIDIKVYKRSQSGTALLYFTGSMMFNRALRHFSNYSTREAALRYLESAPPHPNTDRAAVTNFHVGDSSFTAACRMKNVGKKGFTIRQVGPRVPVYTEVEVFERLGLAWVPPFMRDLEFLTKLGEYAERVGWKKKEAETKGGGPGGG